MSDAGGALADAVQQFRRRFGPQFDRVFPSIAERIRTFQQLPVDRYFYEMCFCICTPQSKARAAWQVQVQLERLDFLNADIDPVPLLRDPHHYIRFHRQKAERLLWLKQHWEEVLTIITREEPVKVKRYALVQHVKGIGWKEASHFLRNIGYTNLAILDRHIVRQLADFHLLAVPRIPRGRREYEQMEALFCDFAAALRISPAHLDLFLWYTRTGQILK